MVHYKKENCLELIYKKIADGVQVISKCGDWNLLRKCPNLEKKKIHWSIPKKNGQIKYMEKK